MPKTGKILAKSLVNTLAYVKLLAGLFPSFGMINIWPIESEL